MLHVLSSPGAFYFFVSCLTAMARTSVQWGMDRARVGLVVSFFTQLRGKHAAVGLHTRPLSSRGSLLVLVCWVFFMMKKHLFLKQHAWEIWKENHHNLLAAGNRVIVARSKTMKSRSNNHKLHAASVKVIVRVPLQDWWYHRRRRFWCWSELWTHPPLFHVRSQSERGRVLLSSVLGYETEKTFFVQLGQKMVI